MIAHSMTIAAPDFPCLWAEAINMAAYLKNRLPHKYLHHQQHPSNVFMAKDQQYHTLSYWEVNVMYISERKSIPLEVNIFHVLVR
jgi:hypothetical protein